MELAITLAKAPRKTGAGVATARDATGAHCQHDEASPRPLKGQGQGRRDANPLEATS